MKTRYFLTVAVLMSCVTRYCIADDYSGNVPAFLQGISVTVKSGTSQGSGTLVSRKDTDGNIISFVWTAAHVIDDLRNVRKVINTDGQLKILVEFKDPQIVAERYQDGRRVGEQTLDCKVIKYSDYEYGEDQALLMIRLRNAYTVDTSAKFPGPHYIPSIGVDLSHCGSLLGQFGSNSYTTGVLSQTGRLLPGKSGMNNKVFDQVTAVAFPGSSGGGVYLKADGTYIGMLTRGVSQLQGFNFIVPVRRMHHWASSVGIEWAIDSRVAMPSMEELAKIPVEDMGTIPGGMSAYAFDRDFTKFMPFINTE